MRRKIIFTVLAVLAISPFVPLVLSGYRGVWVPGTGSTALRLDSIKGWGMVFTLPSSLTARSSNDIDYQMREIYKPERWMRFGWGPTWSGPTLPAEMLTGLLSIRKRVVLARNFIPIGTEYRAFRDDGTQFRSVTTFGESIDYDRADNESSAVFNQAIDSLCWARR